MAEQVLEGTWEEIVHHAPELAGKRVRLTVLAEHASEPVSWPPPNEAMLAALRKIAERNQGKALTSSEETQQLLREARDGGLYGLGSGE
jgi:hypothetical protein